MTQEPNNKTILVIMLWFMEGISTVTYWLLYIVHVTSSNINIPILLMLDAGPAAGEGVGVIEEPAGEGIARASGVWLKSSRQIGDEEL